MNLLLVLWGALIQSTPAARSASHNSTNHNLVERWLTIITLVLKILLWPVRRLSVIIFPSSEHDGLSQAVTAKSAQQFRSYLRTMQNSDLKLPRNGETPPSVTNLWEASGFSAIREQAVQSQALLLIYLHSPLHYQADAVSRQVLCHDSLLQFVADPHVLAMGCSVHTAQGAQLQQALSVTALPYLVVLQPNASSSNSSSTLQLLFRAEGPALLDLVQLDQPQQRPASRNPRLRSSISNTVAAAVEQKLLPLLQTALQKHQVVLAELASRRLQRQEEDALRRQQDEEFAATLQQDQERERQKQALEQAERERMAAEQQEMAAQAEKVSQAQALVRPEPPAGAGTTNIRFVLPTGAKLNRRFGADETIGTLRAYLLLHFKDDEGVMENIGLSTSFPRTTYNDKDDDVKTLQDAGLIPQAVLMVQDMDA